MRDKSGKISGIGRCGVTTKALWLLVGLLMLSLIVSISLYREAAYSANYHFERAERMADRVSKREAELHDTRMRMLRD